MSVNTSVLQGRDGGKETTFRPAECIKQETGFSKKQANAAPVLGNNCVKSCFFKLGFRSIYYC